MYYYRNTFSHLLYQHYSGCLNNKITNRICFMAGVLILLHVFRILCIRRHDIKNVIKQVKEANNYFFEYLQQMKNNGLTTNYGLMMVFIYDKVLNETIPTSVQGTASQPDMQELNMFPKILELLPDVSEKVTLKQLQELWRHIPVTIENGEE